MRLRSQAVGGTVQGTGLIYDRGQRIFLEVFAVHADRHSKFWPDLVLENVVEAGGVVNEKIPPSQGRG